MLWFFLMLAGQEAPHVTPLNSQEWITENDYPPSALLSGAQGDVAFDLTIAETGAVEHCEVSKSSGSADLDTTTCALLAQRARFSTPQAGLHYRGRITWKIPPAPLQPIAWGHSAGVLRLSPDNQVIKCEEKFEGSAKDAFGTPCDKVGSQLPVGFEMIVGKPGKARTVVLELTSYYRDEPPPARLYARPGQVPIARLLVHFDITESGKVENCRQEPTGTEGPLKNLPSPCTWGIGPYVPPVDKAGKPQATQGTIELAISESS